MVRVSTKLKHLLSLVRTTTRARPQGEPLIALDITDPRTNATAKPVLKIVANTHGNEPAGREIGVDLAEWLCKGYAERLPEAVELLRDARVLLVPALNPDGFAARQRGNAAGADLNRDFPDQFAPAVQKMQPETLAAMRLSRNSPCVAAIAFHEGAVVANYAWDGLPSRSRRSEYSRCPDDDTQRALASAYANGHPSMASSAEFPGGITNGAKWYPLYGGNQDWEYINTGCMFITVEANEAKWPPADRLPQLAAAHRPATLALLRQALGGVTGVIVDAGTGAPIPHAEVVVRGREVARTPVSGAGGEFFRTLLPGEYRLVASARGYREAELAVSVPKPATPGDGGVAGVRFELSPTGGGEAKAVQHAEQRGQQLPQSMGAMQGAQVHAPQGGRASAYNLAGELGAEVEAAELWVEMHARTWNPHMLAAGGVLGVAALTLVAVRRRRNRKGRR